MTALSHHEHPIVSAYFTDRRGRARRGAGRGLTRQVHMDDKVNYSLVGVFVLALGAALVAGVLWLAAGMGGQKR